MIIIASLICLVLSTGPQTVHAQKPTWVAPGLSTEYNWNAFLPGAAAAVAALYRWEVLAVADLPAGSAARFSTSVANTVAVVDVLFDQGNPEIWMPLRAFAGAIKENLEIEGLAGVIPSYRIAVQDRGLTGNGWFDQFSGIVVKLDLGAQGGTYLRVNIRAASPGLLTLQAKQPTGGPPPPPPQTGLLSGVGDNALLLVIGVLALGGMGAFFYMKRGAMARPAGVSQPSAQAPPLAAGRASVCFGCGATVPAGATSCPKCGKAKGAPGFKGK